jgi:hypothetical protein
MKVVQIKLESPDFNSTNLSLRRARNLWIGYYILMASDLSLSIFENVGLSNSKEK